MRASCKLAFAREMGNAGIAAPEFLATDSFDQCVEAFGLPFVQKPFLGTCGRGVTLVSIEEQSRPGRLSQRFVSTARSDVRVTIVGGKAVAAIRRTAQPGEWRSNIALGGEFAAEPMTPRLAEFAEAVSDALGMNLGGLDVMEEGGKFLANECNPFPYFTDTRAATGVDVSCLLARLILKETQH